MAGPRYLDWTHVHVRGDRAAAAPYLPEARKLLGYLAEQRQLGQVPTQVIRRRLPDGTLIEAFFHGSIPKAVIHVGAHAEQASNTLQGIVVTPRTFASATAYGANPEAWLLPKALDEEAGTQKWARMLYDSSYAPAEEAVQSYLRVRGHPLFADGLKHGGNVDWRSQDERLVVTWDGPVSRYFGRQGYGGSKVYYNGDVLFDAYTLPEFLGWSEGLGISGACLRGDWLYFALNYVWGGDDHFLRLYRVPVEPNRAATPWWQPGMGHPPRLSPADPALAELLHAWTFPYQSIDPGFGLAAFNQSATKYRTVIFRYPDAPDDFSSVHPVELTVDFTDPENVLATELEHDLLSASAAVHESYGDARLSATEDARDDAGAVIKTAGGTTGSISSPVYVLPTTLDRDIDQELTSVDTYLCAVDWRDDQPVNAYARTYRRQRSGGGTAALTQSLSAVITTGTLFKTNASAATVSESYTETGRVCGLKCYGPNDAGAPWLDVTVAFGGSDSTDAVGSSSFEWNAADGYTAASLSVDRTLVKASTERRFGLWALDLRYETAVYTITERQFQQTVVTSYTGSLNPLSPANYARSGSIDTDVADNTTCQTVGVLLGATRFTWDGFLPNADSTSTTAVGSVQAIDTRDAWGAGAPSGPPPGRATDLAAYQTVLANPSALQDYAGNLDSDQVAVEAYSTSSTPAVILPHRDFDAEAPGGIIQTMTQLGAPVLWPQTQVLPNGSQKPAVFVTLRDAWAFSAAKLEDDTTEPKWASAVRGHDIDSLAGSHAADVFLPVWLAGAITLPR